MNCYLPLFLVALWAPISTAAPADYDVVVYGGTSGGVVAAVQVARSGKSVVLISPTPHLGGLTTSGLGWTDLGQRSILGGLSREFYHRVYQHYQNESAWNLQTRASYGNVGQGGQAFDAASETASVFEPKVAEQIYQDLIAGAGVPVITGRLDLENGVTLAGKRIDLMRLEDGREFRGKLFIDATYEGDLLPGAQVTFTVGREANATYGETVSGVQTGNATKNQLPDGIDPYVVPGDAASGLLAGVEPADAIPDGTADDRLQAFCYRMVLTNVAANRVVIEQPPDYDEKSYELLFRAIEAGQNSGFFKFDLMPNRKTDSNNTGGVSTDFIGMNYGSGWNWTTLNYAQRESLAKKHENWQRGLVWTLQNHPRVPSAIRTAYGSWGLPADEFADNGNWAYQLYVREARRMVSDYVMTQSHCGGIVIAPDSIGLAAYAMDSHNVRRHVKNGMVKNEGDVQFSVPNPYPISYRSIIPKKGECENLLAPMTLSASHMAFGSIRMEPVFMILAQSAAIAANLALEQQAAVQDLKYPELRSRLLAAGQSLGPEAVPQPSVIVDNGTPNLVEATGDWTSAATTAGFVGADYLHDGNVGQGSKQVFYHLPPQTTGRQRVFLRWTSHANRASNVRVEIRHRDGVAVVTVDERANGGKWNILGLYTFSGAANEGVVITTTGANGYVVADAAGFSPVADDDDSDGDGLSDLREILLGLDPFVSNASFITAVKANPGIFGLHAPDEIHDARLGRLALESASNGPLQLAFTLDEVTGSNAWKSRESFTLPVTTHGDRQFFRLTLSPP
jgi:hypothetical protein